MMLLLTDCQTWACTVNNLGEMLGCILMLAIVVWGFVRLMT